MANIGDLKIQIDAIDNASRTLSQVKKNLSEMSGQAMSSGKVMQAGFDSSSKGILKLGASAAIGYMGIQTLTQAVGALATSMVSSASNLEQNRVAFETMLGSAEQASIMMKKISEFAMKTPFTLPQVQEGAKQLLAYNISAEKIIPTFEALGNISAGVGKEKLPQLVLAYGQVRAATKLTGNELRQFTEAGVPLLEILAKQSGKSAAKVKSEMESGMAPSFQEVEKAIFSMSENGGKFFNLMEKQSHTLSGAWSNIQDAATRLGAAIIGVADDGTVATGSLYNQLQVMVTGIVSFLNQNGQKIAVWGSALIGSFSAILTTLWNAVQGLARIVLLPFKIAYEEAKHSWEQTKNLFTGKEVDWSPSAALDIVKNEFNSTIEGLKTDATDMATAWLGASDSVDAAMTTTIGTAQELKKTSDDTNTSIDGISKAAKKAQEELESLSKKVTKANDAIKKENKSYKSSQDDLKSDYKSDLKDMEKDLQKTLLKLETEYVKKTTALREQYNQDMINLKSDLDKTLQDLGDSFNATETEKQKTFQEQIAEEIISKQEEVADLQKKIQASTSEADKAEMKVQLAEAQAFLEKHAADIETYGADIQALKDYQALDAIEKLKYDFEQEKAVRLANYEEQKAEALAQYAESVATKQSQFEADLQTLIDEHATEVAEKQAEYEEDRAERKKEYKQDLEDLKDSHKEKLKELKDHLKEVKKELEKFLNSDEYKKAKNLISSGDAKTSGSRATGGLVSRNQPYRVGEMGPELFVPSTSGRIVSAKNLSAASESSSGGSVNLTVNVGTYAGAYSEKRKLGQEILDAINQTRRAKGLAALG